MADSVIPRTTHRDLQFDNGIAIGMSHRWDQGQYCSILTAAGIVGCGIYDLKTPAEFGQAIAIAKGTPANPLTEPEDLFDAKIVGLTPKASSMGVTLGMTGREAVECMLSASRSLNSPAHSPTEKSIRVKSLDHVTIVVKDLERSRQFYVDILGMNQVARPAFSFDGHWYQAGRTQIHTILEFEGSGPAGNLLPPDQRNSRTHHFAFEVDDAEVAMTQLEVRGVKVLHGPKPRPDGYIQVFVADPDGHVVELCSPPVTERKHS